MAPFVEPTIRRMAAGDAPLIQAAFAIWNKTLEQYERYALDNAAGSRITLVALLDGAVVGYGNLLHESHHPPSRAAGIPEINDLNVVPQLQGRGIGRKLIAALEAIARSAGYARIGIGVVVSPDYANAQRLYPRLGYVPDGTGTRDTEDGPEMHLLKPLD